MKIRFTSKTSLVAENGNTATPTSKSATARDTMKRFVTLRSFEEQSTAAITRQLPGDNIHKLKLKISKWWEVKIIAYYVLLNLYWTYSWIGQASEAEVRLKINPVIGSGACGSARLPIYIIHHFWTKFFRNSND